MPRYFFDFQNGDHLVRDDEGSLLEEHATARSEAITLLAEVVKEELSGKGQRRFIVISQDEGGQFTYQARTVKERLPDGEQKRFTIMVRDEGGQLIYQASLEFHGEWEYQRSHVQLADVDTKPVNLHPARRA